MMRHGATRGLRTCLPSGTALRSQNTDRLLLFRQLPPEIGNRPLFLGQPCKELDALVPCVVHLFFKRSLRTLCRLRCRSGDIGSPFHARPVRRKPQSQSEQNGRCKWHPYFLPANLRRSISETLALFRLLSFRILSSSDLSRLQPLKEVPFRFLNGPRTIRFCILGSELRGHGRCAVLRNHFVFAHGFAA